MKKSNEQKNNFIQRLLTSTLKFKKDNEDVRSKSPVYKFKYELPKSFIKAVDHARVEAGYDLLPQLHRRSSSPSSSSHQTTSEHFRSSSTNDIDRVSTKKIQFRRTPRGHVRQQPKTPLLIPPRPTIRMMMNPNFMMMNRCRRPPNIMPIRMQQQQLFRFRFR
jgi:hypothetical protein